MKRHSRELMVGALILIVGALYFGMTLNIPAKGGIDARFVPFLLSGALFILGILQVISALRMKKRLEVSGASDVEESEKIDMLTVLKTIVLIVIYIAFLKMIGFIIMSALYLFFQFIVLTPADKKKNHIVYAIIAVVSSVCIFLIFRYGFDLMLPAGLLG